MNDVRDLIVQEHAPIVMAPSFGTLQPLERNGHRYIAARDRVMLEVRRPWLHLVWPITEPGALSPPLPYGSVEQKIALNFKLPRELMQQFVDGARHQSPLEYAALLIWNSDTQQLEYRDVELIEWGSSMVRYHRPQLADHESLAVDMHSHGELPAGFSGTDDADDAGEVKLSVVVGSLRGDQPLSWALRLCALGAYIPLPAPKNL